MIAMVTAETAEALRSCGPLQCRRQSSWERLAKTVAVILERWI